MRFYRSSRIIESIKQLFSAKFAYCLLQIDLKNSVTKTVLQDCKTVFLCQLKIIFSKKIFLLELAWYSKCFIFDIYFNIKTYLF